MFIFVAVYIRNIDRFVKKKRYAIRISPLDNKFPYLAFFFTKPVIFLDKIDPLDLIVTDRFSLDPIVFEVFASQGIHMRIFTHLSTYVCIYIYTLNTLPYNIDCFSLYL